MTCHNVSQKMMFLFTLVALVATTTTIHGQEIIKITSAEDMQFLHLALDNDVDGFIKEEDGIIYIKELVLQKKAMAAFGIMQHMDKDQDGKLSLEEYKDDLQHLNMDDKLKEDFVKSFSDFDDDGDGMLSRMEVLPLFAYMFPFQKLDLDKDGYLTKAEFMKTAKSLPDEASPELKQEFENDANRIFKALDMNEDMKLDPKEYFHYESGLLAGLEAWKELIVMSDKDGDGKVSSEDWVEVRHNPKFGGSAAYHHSKEWIKQIKEIFNGYDQQEAMKGGEL